MRTLSTTHTTRHVEVKWRKGKSCFSRNTDEQGIPEEAEKTESSTLSKILCKWKQDSVISFFLYLDSAFKYKHKLVHNQSPV